MSLTLFEEMRRLQAAGDAVAIAHNPPPPVQLYYLAHAPAELASYLPDSLLLSAAHDVAQLLSTQWVLLDEPLLRHEWGRAPDTLPGELEQFTVRLAGHPIYRSKWLNEPVAAWVRATTACYRWTAELGIELAAEHRFRFKKPMALESCLQTLLLVPPHLPVSEDIVEPPVLVEEVVVEGYVDAVASYRAWLAGQAGKAHFYTRRQPPSWLR